MEVEVPELALGQLAAVERTMAKLKASVEAAGVLSIDRMAELPPVDRVQALIATILATQSLFVLQHRLRGRDPSSNDLVRKEKVSGVAPKGRLNQYVARVRKLVDQKEAKKRELTVDVEAVNRFIAGAVSDKAQKRSLLELNASGRKTDKRQKKKQKEAAGKDEFVGQVLSFALR
ncbi:hypothetical protein QBZ16_003535 [Prototheca wickerhamii]|uniref:Nuclear nucleic acid-binding protein C1D n=1 Tax=Prototheca wickerhamii TaxID=3111 RepID=A0AAD9IL84_PROWI|nr:hypothetical protein QBZ16_003535 [Prototheca wickerhamii]